MPAVGATIQVCQTSGVCTKQPSTSASYSIEAPWWPQVSRVAVQAFAHVKHPGTLTHFLLCRCQSDGPFRLDPEEVEGGRFMSLQVQTLNDSLIPSSIDDMNVHTYTNILVPCPAHGCSYHTAQSPQCHLLSSLQRSAGGCRSIKGRPCLPRLSNCGQEVP